MHFFFCWNIYGFFHLKGPVLNPRAEGFFQLSGLAPTNRINDPEKSITSAFSSVIAASSWVFFFFNFLLQLMLLLELNCAFTRGQTKKKQENKSVPEGGGGVILLVADLRSAVQCLQECLRVRDLKRFWSFAASFPPRPCATTTTTTATSTTAAEKRRKYSQGRCLLGSGGAAAAVWVQGAAACSRQPHAD